MLLLLIALTDAVVTGQSVLYVPIPGLGRADYPHLLPRLGNVNPVFVVILSLCLLLVLLSIVGFAAGGWLWGCRSMHNLQ